jgi:HEAT repeat protein
MLGESVDRDTARARRDVLSAALESRDAGLRYAAATALGDFGGPEAVGALRKRLDWEKNISVRRVIEAELRK